MNIRDEFDLEIHVKKIDFKEMEVLLTNNEWPFNAVQMIYGNVYEFTIYKMTFKKVEALKKLLKDKHIKYY